MLMYKYILGLTLEEHISMVPSKGKHSEPGI